MHNNRVGFHLPKHRRIDVVVRQRHILALEPLPVDAGLIHDIDMWQHFIRIRGEVEPDVTFLQVVDDVLADLEFGRGEKVQLHPVELAQEIGERANGAPCVEGANQRNRKAIERVALAFANREGVEECLRRVLSAGTVSRVDDWNMRDRCGAFRSTFFIMTQDDDVAVVGNDADGVLKLLAFASLKRADITVALAREALRDKLRNAEENGGESATDTLVEGIQRAVAQEWGITVDGLRSKTRTRTLTVPRQAAMYLLRQITGLQLVEIGAAFGNRDHSTVIHSLERVEQMIKSDEVFRGRVEKLRKRLGSPQ